jgi:hypothetical protein
VEHAWEANSARKKHSSATIVADDIMRFCYANKPDEVFDTYRLQLLLFKILIALAVSA